jgi:hypothetical protein
MRRGPLGAIVFGLALLMQLIVPTLASQDSAVGLTGHIPSCVQGSPSDADGSGSDGAPPRHEHCVLCQIVCGALGLLEVRSDLVTLSSPAETRAAWALASERRAEFDAHQHRFPRGPPILA